MFVAAWSFDMHYGAREETLATLKDLREKITKAGWKAKHTRVLAGSIGAPESRVIIEHEFASLADLEASWESLHKSAEMFKTMVGKMKPLIISGTPKWEIYRVVDES
jgi:hypothetical protein